MHRGILSAAVQLLHHPTQTAAPEQAIASAAPAASSKSPLHLINQVGDDWALSGPSAGSGRHRLQGSESSSAPILGSFAWSLSVTRFVTLTLVGTHFAVKGKIWSARPFQALLFSPPAEEREPCANDDYQHGKRNPEPEVPAPGSGGRFRSGGIRCAGRVRGWAGSGSGGRGGSGGGGGGHP